MEKQKTQPCPHTSKHLNTTIHPKESPKRCSYVPPYTTRHRTFEYNHQPQGVHKKGIVMFTHILLYTTEHLELQFFTPLFSVILNSLPFGPISLLPPVQSLPIGNTCPEDVQRRLTPHPSDLLSHPEQMSRVVDNTGHIEEMGRVRLQEEPVPWDGLDPPPLSVAKPLHHTREPKVGSSVSVRPELNRGLIPIEAMEMNTLQGVRDLILRQAQYLPV